MKLLQLKITLLQTEPEIWRRVLVPDALSLFELHTVIQGAMGWADCHLHNFKINGRKYEAPEQDEYGPEEGYLDERLFTIAAAVKGISEFFYLYDFGDCWGHLIEIEERTYRLPGAARWPVCVDGENACPPEDCGGVEGYFNMLTALTDKNHPNHKTVSTWVGAFDQLAFNATQATSLIQCGCALMRERRQGFGEDAVIPPSASSST